MGFPCANPNFSPFRINLCAVEHSSVLRRFDNKLIQALTSFSLVVAVAREGQGLRQRNLVCLLWRLRTPQLEVELFLG